MASQITTVPSQVRSAGQQQLHEGEIQLPPTLRLGPGTKDRLRARAARVGVPERTLAREDVHLVRRRATIVGRGLDVWEVVATVRDNDADLVETARYLDVPLGLVEAAVAYYGEHQHEIDREIQSNEEEYERGRGAAAAGHLALHG